MPAPREKDDRVMDRRTFFAIFASCLVGMLRDAVVEWTGGLVGATDLRNRHRHRSLSRSDITEPLQNPQRPEAR